MPFTYLSHFFTHIRCMPWTLKKLSGAIILLQNIEAINTQNVCFITIIFDWVQKKCSIEKLTLTRSDRYSEGTLERVELPCWSLLTFVEFCRNGIALYRCKSLSDDTYGKYWRATWPLLPKARTHKKAINERHNITNHKMNQPTTKNTSSIHLQSFEKNYL